ncbi:gp53-like domain-containing protein [Serratia quinivorans]|uniref:gp53-like domain-containing protein n=1 Tax=Serratia quinivorans TaxID=137545 RepID=UPI003F978E38
MQKVGSVTETADQNSEFTNGNVAQGVPPTILEAAIFNTWQREMCNVVEGSGIALEPTDDGQLLKAIKKTNKDQTPALLAANGHQELPSGLIIQWGNGIAGIDGSKRVLFPTPYKIMVFSVIVTPTNRFNANTMIGANVDNTNYQLTGFDMISYSLDLDDSKVVRGSNGFTWMSFGY